MILSRSPVQHLLNFNVKKSLQQFLYPFATFSLQNKRTFFDTNYKPVFEKNEIPQYIKHWGTDGGVMVKKEAMDCNLLLPSIGSKPTFDSTNGIVRLVREEPPAHCIFKVESFSKLTKDQVDSAEFKAGGYTWVLSVYPKGNKQKHGDDHVSLFVSMVDKLSSGSFVYVMLRFFIYDQLRENFLTVLDIRDKLIHADMNSATGIAKFLPLDTFTHASNGFLVNDFCVFGAEVFVIKDAPNNRSCAFAPSIKDTAPYSYTWRIENFSQTQNLDSPVILFGEWSWKLSISRSSTDLGKYLAVFLELQNPRNITERCTLYTQFQLCLKNQGGRENRKKTSSRNFPKASTLEASWGFPSFIQISDLHKGFLVNDVLILEVHIEEMVIE